MSEAQQLLALAAERQILLYLEDGKLKFKAPQGAMDPEFIARLKAVKPELMTLLAELENAKSSTRSPLAMNSKIEPQHKDSAPLSDAQRRLWFIEQLGIAGNQYNMPLVLKVTGDFKLDCAKQALAALVARHHVLHTVYVDGDNGPMAQRLSAYELELGMDDLSALPLDERDNACQQRIKEQLARRFDLSQDLMVRMHWLQLAHNEGVLVLNMHHIASDGWSVGIVAREFAALYRAFSQGTTAELKPLPFQYSDYAWWQNSALSSDALAEQLHYWQNQLKEVPAVHGLPLKAPRSSGEAAIAKQVSATLNAEASEALHQLARAKGMTMFMLLHGALALVLSRFSNSDDIVVGTPLASRNQSDLEALVGLFVNTLVLRTNTEDCPLDEYLNKVKQLHLDAQANQDVPFDYLVEHCNVARSTSHLPLFQILFAASNVADAPSLDIPGLNFSAMGNQGSSAKFELDVRAEIGPSAITLRWLYDSELFESHLIENLNLHLCTLLEHLPQDLSVTLSRVEMIPHSQRELLLYTRNQTQQDFNRPARLDELFEAQAKATPQATALIFAEKRLSYAQLNERANALAWLLKTHGVGADKLVGLCLNRTEQLVVAMLGILKAGGAYVPVDPNYPDARIAYMLNDSGVELVVSEQALEAKLNALEGGPHGLNIISLDSDTCQAQLAGQSVDNLPCDGKSPEHLSHIIYTSGSTGLPKGVMIAQQNSAAMVNWAGSAFEPQVLRKVLFATSVCFDLSVFEVFVPLCHGGCVVVAENVLSATKNSDLSLINTVPSAMDALLSAGNLPSSVVQVNLAGEPLEQALVARLYQAGVAQVYDLYGPSEDTTYSTYGLRQAGGYANIGKPIANTFAYILDSHGQLLPDGALGELYLGGAGVARGYLNQPELTEQRFLANPFAPGRMYRTGDLVRYSAEGKLIYCGRADEQLKIRGFRVELGEIGEQLSQCEQVHSALVVARKTSGQQPKLVAYVQPNAECQMSESQWQQTLKQHLLARLPGYMVPEAFVIIDQWPRTTSGKVDKNALPEPVYHAEQSAVQAPKDALERSLCAIWCEVLSLEDVGTAQPFFDIGGNSLHCYAVQQKIKQQLGVDIALTDLFTYTTIAELAHFIHGFDQVQAGTLVSKAKEVKRGDKIAVIAMACRFPDADDVTQFWQNLLEGKESLTEFDDESLLATGVSAAQLSDPNFVRSGVLLPQLDCFDAELFGFTPSQAMLLDPQQRLLFECVNDCLEQAGLGGHKGSNTGVFVGVGESNYLLENLLQRADIIAQVGGSAIALGNSRDFVATKIAHKFDLTGPAYTVATACSTGLVNIHLACESLRQGQCDTALAGGASVGLLSPRGFIAEPGGTKSPTGICRAFDEQADGTRGGSGAGLVLLKPLTQAIKDNDNISAVIVGSSCNNDGADKVGFTAPSVSGQAKVIVDAIQSAGVDIDSIGYIETHGTGTKVGDPIEIAALTKAFNSLGRSKDAAPCALGTTKPNIGHLDSAAGIAGFIKAAMVVEQGMLAKALHFNQPNSQIDFAGAGFFVPRENQAFSCATGPRRAAVSSFGMGGTNAHVVLEQYQAKPEQTKAEQSDDNAQLIMLSAATEQALEDSKARLLQWLELAPQSIEPHLLPRLAYTLATGRAQRAFRFSAVAKDVAGLQRALSQPGGSSVVNPSKARATLVMMFPGQGSQYAQMGAQLYQAAPQFKAQFDACAAILNPLLKLDLVALLNQPTLSNDTAIVQPLLFAFEYALAKQWQALGITPDVMIGHSLGEYVAACLAGVFSLEDALKLVVKRADLMQSLEAGAMLSVSLSETDLQPLLADFDCCLAAVNGPELCVAAGRTEQIEKLNAMLGEKGVKTRLLATSHAFHSKAIDAIIKPFIALFDGIELNAPKLPFVSNLSAELITAEQAQSPQYWANHMRQAVRFGDGLAFLAGRAPVCFLEVGPGKTLSALARIHCEDSDNQCINSVGTAQSELNDWAFMLDSAGALWRAGFALNLTEVTGKQQVLALPQYPYDRQKHWVDAPSRQYTERLNQDIDSWCYQPVWQSYPVTGQSAEPQRIDGCVIVLGESALCHKVSSELSALANRVVSVKPGAQFTQLSDSEFTVMPGNKTDYQQLLALLGAEVVAVVHGFNSGERLADERRLAVSAQSVLYWAQLLGESSQPRQLLLLSEQGQAFDSEERAYPERAMLSAMAKVINAEFNHINACYVDADQSVDIAKVMQQLSDTGNDTHCLRFKRLWRQGYVSVQPQQAFSGVKKGGVYGISGGLGGVGLTLAKALAEQAEVKLVLLARHTENLSQNVQNTIAQIRERGSEVHIVKADVCDLAQLSHAINEVAQQVGQFDGFVHSAGVAGGGLISLKDSQSMAQVLAAKVNGTDNLARVLKGHCLEWFVACSSITALHGVVGQFDYAAANAYLDGAAERFAEHSCRYISINWDSWAEVGMSAAQLAGKVLPYALTPAHAAQWFIRLIQAPGGNYVVTKRPIQKGLSAQAPEQNHQPNAPAPSLNKRNNRPMLSSDYVAPEFALEKALCEIWRGPLGISPIGKHDNFFELGGDSLVLTRVLGAINQQFDINIAIHQAFDNPTIAELAVLVGAQTSGGGQGPDGPEDQDLYEQEVIL